MASRDGAVSRALAFFDGNGFRDRLADLVAIPSTSQDPAHLPDVERYLGDAIQPWLRGLGFTVAIHPNPRDGFGPDPDRFAHIEDPALPTVLTYGHGDTVRGLEDQWTPGLDPWTLTERGELWYGRGTADNKGQHALNLSALEAVLEERGGRLGYNLKLVLETSEERGSTGLREFVAANRESLAADVLIASDGPRVMPEVPTIATGTRGTYHFDLVVDLRAGGVHSGHWGGLTTDPAVVLVSALGTIIDRNGKILVRDWLPRNVRAHLDVLALPGAGRLSGRRRRRRRRPSIPAGASRGLPRPRRSYRLEQFHRSRDDLGAVPRPRSTPWRQTRGRIAQSRYTVDTAPAGFGDAVRRHLDAEGFTNVKVENPGVRMPASLHYDPSNPWVHWAVASMERSLAKRVQVIPNSSGGLPGDVFVDHLGTPLIWVPHSYNGCKQHGPDEHFLRGPAREGIAAFAGLWRWDLGEPGIPRRNGN